ncbi:acyl-CoA dehydrogenase [Curtobacterium sp. MCBD17_032]|uniref:acyl-CoA dehydrogenase n=1 Tax=Curtobacterium sp. MCBD17_032 TaxID=2175659 RepID=UPI000DA775BE|nr:acyl-CoA dehydrogenase [Curtobacterium sp. MCBD17_032]PZE86764.1 acyl-CoA dehydrogenase [Curtobacterium sp. MCBD17_032]
MSGQSTAPASRRTKIFALATGGALVVGGVGLTLAAWTDTEWVFGGNGAGGAGVGTSTFEVEQSVAGAPFTAGWTQAEANPGQGMTFTADALALSPGEASYAAVALRTVSGSVAGSLRLESATPAAGITTADTDEILWDALQVRVATTATSASCGAATFNDPAAVIASGPLGTAGAATTQALAANSGSAQAYCFEVSLPATPALPTGVELDALQGRTVAPAWEFTAESA